MDLFGRIKEWVRNVFPFNNSDLGFLNQAYKRTRLRTRKIDVTPALVKSKPLTLEERYRIVEDQREVESIFKQMTSPLMSMCDEFSTQARAQGSGRVILRQIGLTDDQRSYLFMKPMSEPGWLIEMGPAGWRVSHAEQIVNRDMFMRSHQDPWDVATIWRDPRGEGLTRIRSVRFGHELMTINEYERRLSAAFREIFIAGQVH